MIAVGSGTSLSCSGFCRPESAGLGVWTAGSSEVPSPFRRVAGGLDKGRRPSVREPFAFEEQFP